MITESHDNDSALPASVLTPPPTQPAPRVTSSEWAILAGVRMALALLVMFYHMPPPLLTNAASGRLNGFAAVLGFFLISGYSIAASLEKDRDLKVFYGRRAFRILPVALLGNLIPLCIVVADAYGWVKSDSFVAMSPKDTTLIGNFLMLQSFAVEATPQNLPLWSLSIECVYYLFAPLLFRMSSRNLSIVVFLSFAAYCVHWYYGQTGYAYQKYGIGAICLVWSWIAGLILHRLSSKAKAAIPLGILFVLGGCFTGSDMENIGPFVLLCSVCAVCYAGTLTVPDKLAKALNYAGELSYPLYATHFVVIYFLAGHYEDWTHPPRWFNPYTVALLCLAVAALVYHAVDKPLRASGYRSLKKKPRVAT